MIATKYILLKVFDNRFPRAYSSWLSKWAMTELFIALSRYSLGNEGEKIWA